MIARFTIAVLFAAITAAAANVSIRLSDGAFRVDGWSASVAPPGGWESVFAVYAVSDADEVPPLLGRYEIESGALTFRPRFPLSPGIRLRAVFHATGLSPVEASFEIPSKRNEPSTQVANIYPSSDTLPANQLKFYVVFSAPMSRGEAWQRIHLLDRQGKAVDLPFLELGEELWDPQFTRLTILFDPGRIKRGVLPREQIGPAIEPGQEYTLVIDREWRDGGGQPLKAEFRKSFRVGPETRTGIDPHRWKIHAPRAGSTEGVVVELDRPMDYALLLRVIGVTGPKGAVAGKVSTDRAETQWRFVPDDPWKAGDYKLNIDRSLEDLAGNRIGRPFDVDTFDPISKHLTSQTVSLPFRVTNRAVSHVKI